MDLHIHSVFSDGKYDIKELIDLLIKNNIKVFSITDHDNILSYYDINKYDLKGLKYISGVEISTYMDNLCFHILGYNYHGDITKLKELLSYIGEKRKERALEVINKIENNNGIKFLDSDIEDIINKPSVGKKHIAKLLIKKNYKDDYKYLLDRFFKGLHPKISYRVDVKEACNCIKGSSGIAILAHPKEYEVRYGINIEDYIEKLIECGIDGIEVYNSFHDKNDVIRYKKIAKKYNLLISGGSDFHNDNYNYLGNLYNGYNKEKVKLSILDEVK